LAAAGDGFDLRRIPPNDGDLFELAMSAFNIDPKAPGARQRLSWALRRKRSRERPGRRNDDFRVALAMQLEGVAPSHPEGVEPSDRDGVEPAPAIARRIARYFPNIAETSLITKVRRWLRSYRAGKLRIGG
jgi:hypothetical protein